MLKLIDVKQRYQNNEDYTLKGINYSFLSCGLYYIVGKSGCGKSTLLSLLGCIDYSFEGDILYENKSFKKMSEEEKEEYRYSVSSFCFQDYKANEEETLLSNLRKTLFTSEMSDKEIDETIDFYLDKVDLTSRKECRFKVLSLGEKKRASIIRAVIKKHRVLLLDEPLSGLNSSMRKRVTELLFSLSKDRLVIVITHDKDEIKEEATVLNLTDGLLVEEKKGISYQEKDKKDIRSRKKISLKRLIRLSFSLFQGNKRFLYFSILTLVISLFSISISFILNNNILSSITHTFQRFISNDSLVVEKKEDLPVFDDYESPPFIEVDKIKRSYPTSVECIYYHYLDSLDDIFEDNRYITINYQNSKIPFNISLDSFLRFETCVSKDLFDIEEMSDDELILGLKDEYITAVSKMMFSYSFPFIEDALSYINSSLEKDNLYLNMILNVNSFKYHGEYSMKIVRIVRDEKNIIIHKSTNFSEHFINDVLHFKSMFINDEEEQVPWMIRKIFSLRLYKNKSAVFFENMIKDERFDKYVFFPVVEEGKKRKDIIDVFYDCYAHLKYSQINSFCEENREEIEDVFISSPVYSFTASNFIAGFQKPFFFSSRKDKLNEIEDNYYISDIDLGSFQSSMFDVDEKVIKADFLSSYDDDALFFKSSLKIEDKILSGKICSDNSSIMISKGLKERLFPYLNLKEDKLFVLSLDKTERRDDRYINYFSQNELSISGVVDEDIIAIYQTPLFPLIYSFANTEIDSSELFITQAIITLNDKADKDEILRKINEKEGLKGSFPLLNMSREMKRSMNRISFIFYLFSTISLILSFFLFAITFYILIDKDRKQIGVMLSLGYKKREINMIYFIFNCICIMFSFSISFLFTALSERVINKTLASLLTTYQSSLTPYLISLITSLAFLFLFTFYVKYSLKNISPREAFSKS